MDVSPCAQCGGTERQQDGRCVACNREKGKRHYQNGGAIRASRRHREKTYGLTPLAVEAQLRAQGGGCAICRVPLIETGRAADVLCVDHCHTTLRLRGLLCNHCNRGIGMFKDTPALLDRAAQYLVEGGAR